MPGSPRLARLWSGNRVLIYKRDQSLSSCNGRPIVAIFQTNAEYPEECRVDKSAPKTLTKIPIAPLGVLR